MTTPEPPLTDWLRDPDVEVVRGRAGPAHGRPPAHRPLVGAQGVARALPQHLRRVRCSGRILLWFGARSAGLIDNIETLVEELGFAQNDTFSLRGPEILKMTAVIGPIVVVLGALATVAGVAVFNAMTRLFGGVEVTVADGD